MLSAGQYEINRFYGNERKVVFIAEYEATPCMGCVAESFLALDGRHGEVGE